MPEHNPPPAYCIPHAADAEEHFLRWQAHVEAGRIGRRAAPDPAAAATAATLPAQTVTTAPPRPAHPIPDPLVFPAPTGERA